MELPDFFWVGRREQLVFAARRSPPKIVALEFVSSTPSPIYQQQSCEKSGRRWVTTPREPRFSGNRWWAKATDSSDPVRVIDARYPQKRFLNRVHARLPPEKANERSSAGRCCR